MTSTVADILQRIEALSQSEQQELVTAICDRWGIANESEEANWAESIRDKIDEAYASTEPSVDGSTFIQQRRSTIDQNRLQDLRHDALIGWESSQRGESIDGPTAIAQIRTRLHAKHDQILTKLNQVYTEESSDLDPVIANLQLQSLSHDGW
jgi:hypothetical protein